MSTWPSSTVATVWRRRCAWAAVVMLVKPRTCTMVDQVMLAR
jgi:hypothetical protein